MEKQKEMLAKLNIKYPRYISGFGGKRINTIRRCEYCKKMLPLTMFEDANFCKKCVKILKKRIHEFYQEKDRKRGNYETRRQSTI
jgi:rRNA maturation endonuclease Nob1